MEEKNNQRYDRQRLIKGWDQQALTNGTVTIIGSGNLAKYISLPLVALGIGNLRLIDSDPGKKGDSLLDIPLDEKVKVKSLESALRRINPEVNIIGINSNLSTHAAQYFLQGSKVIIDATNNIISKKVAWDYHRKSKTPLISVSCNKNQGKGMISLDARESRYPWALMPMFTNAFQGDLVSLEMGGVFAEETKKLLMNNPEVIKEIYNYNLTSKNRFDFHCNNALGKTANSNAFKDKKILLVGAGALGCFLGPCSAVNLRPASIDIMDYDCVEEHNLNRQVCFYDAVGKLKAERLSETLTKLSKGKTKVKSLVDKFKENSEFETKYDLIFDAVDGFYSKAIVHNYAKRNGIPIISGGTDPRAATVLVYVPGKTPCFDCQINLTTLALKNEIIRRTSCLVAPDPSVIMTNQIAGAIMVGEARCVLRPDIFGEPINGEIKYISDFDSRGGINMFKTICRCYEENRQGCLELPDPKRVKIEEINNGNEIIKAVYVDGRML